MGLRGFKAPPLPSPPYTGEYSKEQMLELIRVLELYFSKLDSDAAIETKAVFVNGSSLEVESRRYALLVS